MNASPRSTIALVVVLAVVGFSLVPAAGAAAVDPVPATPQALGAVSAPAVGVDPALTVRGDIVDRGARRIARIMSRMTLSDKVGQLFVQEFAGQDADNPDPQSAATNMTKYGVPSASAVVARYHLGGVIYFTNNIVNPQQLAGMSDALQRTALGAAPRIPLAISVDQEGGVVTRILSPASVSPGSMAVGATFDPTNAKKVARVLSSEAAAMGIRLDYAPVADVNTNPKNSADGPRAFGDKPGKVSKFVTQAIVGQQAYSVATSAKHFPGLGSAEVNTDEGTATSEQTKRQFQTLDFPPFQAAIAAKTDSVMMSHLIAPGLDPSGKPASLSKTIVTGILRKQLGFNGMVITDALDAKALVQWTPAQLARKAFKAGDDMLLMSGNLPQAIEAIKADVRSGKITRTRLDASVRRILQLKYDNGILDRPWSAGPAGVSATVGSPAHLAKIQDIANQSTTLLARSAPSAPLHPGSNLLLTGYGATALPPIDGLLTAAGATVQRIVTGINPSAADIAGAVAAAPGHDAVVLMTYNAWANPGQQQLIAQLLATGVPVIVGMLGGPYDAALAPNARAVIALYSGSVATAAQVSFVNVLFGRQPVGRLPVSVPSVTNPQQVVFPYGTGLRWN